MHTDGHARRPSVCRAERNSDLDARPRVDSGALMRGARRLIIEHNGEEYILQVTRAGRLILTK